MTRGLGIALTIVSFLLLLLGGLFLIAGLASGSLTPAGAVLGFGLLLVVLVIPIGGLGIFALLRSRREAKEDAQSEAEADELRKILDMVDAQGKVHVSDMILELGTSQSAVHGQIYRLVGMELFDGYINWDDGVLFSKEASALQDLNQCYNCGGNIEIAGKGVFQCPFCGTEYFLSTDRKG